MTDGCANFRKCHSVIEAHGRGPWRQPGPGHSLELDEFLGVVRQVQPFLFGDETDPPLLHRQGTE